MTPAAAIASLDSQLADHGEDITIVRDAVSVPCRAKVVGVKADEVAGMVAANDQKVVMSPTQITASAFPGMPDENDIAVIKGRECLVKHAEPVFLGGVWVRSNLLVTG